MKITEKLLLDNYVGKIDLKHNKSIIDGEELCWSYYTEHPNNGNNPPIYVNDDEVYINLIIEVSDDNLKHPSLTKMIAEEVYMWEIEISLQNTRNIKKEEKKCLI